MYRHLRIFQITRRIEVTQMCHLAGIEPDVGRRDISVNYPVLMDLADRSAKLAGPSEEFRKRHPAAFILPALAVITQLSARQILKSQELAFVFHAKVVQGHDVVMRAHPGQQGSFVLRYRGLSVRRKNGQSNRTACLCVPCQVRLLLRARTQQLIDPVPTSKKRSCSQYFVHVR